MKPWAVYTVVRLGIFVVTLAVLLLVGTGWIWGAIFATGISLAISVLFLGGLRRKVAEGIQRRVEKPEKDEDSTIEDEQVSSAD